MFSSLTLPHCNDYLLKLFSALSLDYFGTILPRKFPHLFLPDRRTNEGMRADLLNALLLAFGAPSLPLSRSPVFRKTRLSLFRQARFWASLSKSLSVSFCSLEAASFMKI